MEYEQALRKTTDSEWEALSFPERREVLQAIEHHTAQFEERAEREILIEPMKDNYYGFYDPKDSGHLHVSYLALQAPDEAVKTTFHEGRHAYQHDCLDENKGFPQPILEQFRDGFNNYIDPEENYYAYVNNFTERDAEDFAEQQYRLMCIDRDALLERDSQENEAEEMEAPEAEMNMAPGMPVEAEEMETPEAEMNMAPGMPVEAEEMEAPEAEMNMAPGMPVEAEEMEAPEAEMNMAPGMPVEAEEMEAPEAEMNMTPDIPEESKANEQAADPAGNNQMTEESVDQEQGFF